MGDLSEFMPQQSETVRLIEAHYKARADAEPQRGYLGASVVGDECDRFLWFTFRGVIREDVEGRMYRLWQTGHREEARMLEDLRAIGCTVWDRDPGTGEQFALEALGGHFSGHLDAVVLGVPEAPKSAHVAECKTHRASSFNALVKKGVRVAEPVHFAQMQAYMGGMKLGRALYLAHNKDTDALYSERVKFESDFYKRLLERAERIIRTSKAPERVASRVDDWRCKMCPAQTLCWGDAEAPAVPIRAQTCKACVHSTAETEGAGARWSCARYQTEVDPAIGAECPSFLLLPGLVNFAEPTDADEDWIEFKNTHDGATWRHGPGLWTTKDLMTSRGPLARPLPTICGKRCDFECCARVDPVPRPCGRPSGHEGRCACATTRARDPRYVEPPDPTAGPAAPSATGPAESATSPATGASSTDRSPSDPLLAVNFGDAHGGGVFGEDSEGLLARYPWGDSWRVWDGPADQLEAALENDPDLRPLLSPALEVKAVQNDAQVNAAEFELPSGDVLIVTYKKENHAAIWRGKA